tara:strand:+ start:966 stop:1283 length:318 start_codon:yes stop_codon:yes gene_type:complete
LGVGECCDFKKRLRRWESWEKEYSRRGFRTVSLDKFLDSKDRSALDKFVNIKRLEKESPISHAGLYREHYLGKVHPVIDFSDVMNKGVAMGGTIYLPSTEALIED